VTQVDVLIHEASYERIAQALRERCPQVRAVTWHSDGSMSVGRQSIAAGDTSPRAGWISVDVLGAKLMDEYTQALCASGSIEWIQTINAGLDFPGYAQLAEHGITISKSGAQSIPIAEYVLAYALEHTQKFDERRAGEASKTWAPHRFGELWHANWVIVGYGHIGRNVAKRAKAFDSHITVIRRTQATDEFIDVNAPPQAILEHLPTADFVVLACPATDETRGMANAEFFAAMKPGSLLVNIARGALVDEETLMAGLDAGRPGRAVLDVFNEEPLPQSSALWTHPGVTITAHISNAGSGTRERGDELFLSNLERFLDGSGPLDPVFPAAFGF
jgi:phosphoglycerate dehydrogenase-like enzyme